MDVEYLQEDIVWEGIDGDSCEGFGLACIVRLYNIPKGICGLSLTGALIGLMLFDTQPF